MLLKISNVNKKLKQFDFCFGVLTNDTYETKYTKVTLSDSVPVLICHCDVLKRNPSDSK